MISKWDSKAAADISSPIQYEKVKEFFADTKKNNYNFAVGESEVAPGKGFFVQPTIIDNPPNDSRIITEEPFGPIVPTQPWSDEEEVIKRANNTNAGLGACVWGKDIERAERIGKRLQAGSVFINSWEKPTPQAFFGGHKESGIGGEWGKEGLKAYCNVSKPLSRPLCCDWSLLTTWYRLTSCTPTSRSKSCSLAKRMYDLYDVPCCGLDLYSHGRCSGAGDSDVNSGNSLSRNCKKVMSSFITA